MPARRTLMKNTSIHEAVKQGDVAEVEAMVKNGASINEIDSTKDRFTPVHWACHVGALECLHWLLWHKADATVMTPKGWTAAHIAAIRGQDACLQALLNNGANMNAKDSRGATPAHMAAAHGNSFSLNSILRAGVEVNTPDRHGWTPVHSACFHGRLGCLQLLTRWGGKIDEVDNNGNTPAHLAAMEGHLPCLKFLISESQHLNHVIHARNDNGETPKMLAQQFYKEQVTEYIDNIEWERDHPEEAENLSFPAHVAAYNNDLIHLRLLVENGVVNVNERDDKGSTPAHKAAGQGHVEVLQWLIEMGANMTVTNNVGESPKDIARRFAQLGAVKLLGGDEAEDVERKLEKAGDEELLGPESEWKIAEEAEPTYGAEEGEESGGEEDLSPPTVGNSDGQTLHMTKDEIKLARGRARRKYEELERALEIAKRNFLQFGGKLADERKRLREDRDAKSHVETITELEAQLDYERVRREKLEAQLDEYRREVTYLHNELDKFHQGLHLEELERNRDKKKKTLKKRSSSASRDPGVFVRKNVLPTGKRPSSGKAF